MYTLLQRWDLLVFHFRNNERVMHLLYIKTLTLIGLLTPRALWLQRVAATIRVVRSDELLSALRSRPIIGILRWEGSTVLAPYLKNQEHPFGNCVLRYPAFHIHTVVPASPLQKGRGLRAHNLKKRDRG
jgi:hypothetical protein